MAWKARRFTQSLAVLMIVGVAPSCAGNPTEPTRVPLGQPFELRAGATANLVSSLAVTFLRVNSDSRCPMDALCVWAGEAAITIGFEQSSGSVTGSAGTCTVDSNRAECVLATTPNGSTVLHGAYTVRLVQLAPYPSTATPIKREDYVATLTVSSR